MASKARELDKEKESYINCRNKFKKIRRQAWEVIAFAVCFPLLLLIISICVNGQEGLDTLFLYLLPGLIIPVFGAAYYITCCNEKVKEYDALIEEVDLEREEWAKKLKQTED